VAPLFNCVLPQWWIPAIAGNTIYCRES
jgi:hypothetical protein